MNESMHIDSLEATVYLTIFNILVCILLVLLYTIV